MLSFNKMSIHKWPLVSIKKWTQIHLGYKRLFSISEIESSLVLQFVMGALVLSSFISFFGWIESTAITTASFQNGSHICWSYWQSCGEYYFFDRQPVGYTQEAFYVGLLMLLVGVVYSMWKKNWALAHALLSLVLIWKAFVMFGLTTKLGANFDYYDVILAIPFLFFPYKLFFVRLIFVLLYFLASTIKIHDGWVLATYFTSLQLGLPIFGHYVAPLATNLVIFMQMVGAWFLLSQNTLHQRLALTFFLSFHIYSGLLVHYRYLTTAIPMILILFGPMNKFVSVPLSRKSLYGWSFVTILVCLQLVPQMIAGDHKITGEGNRYGLYMFDANHQCVASATILNRDGSSEEWWMESYVAQFRCNPYETWFTLKQRCLKNDDISSISLKFDHSINGSPFYRIIDESNICNLEYSSWRHNNWILTPETGAVPVGVPRKNIYNL